MPNYNGDGLLTLFNSIVSNGVATVDPVYALQLINVARADFEQRRMWQVLKAKDTSLTVQAGFNPTVPYAMPSPTTPSLATPYAMQYLLEGSMLLVDPINSMNFIPLLELPFENQVGIQQANAFYVDYPNRQFYVVANLSGAFTIYQFFQADYGDIQATAAGATVATNWIGFPPKFAPMLSFQAAARYRLGSDYDDISAQNGNQNFQASEALYKAAMKWDMNLALNGYQHRPFSAINGGGPGYGPGSDQYGGYGMDVGGPGRTLW